MLAQIASVRVWRSTALELREKWIQNTNYRYRCLVLFLTIYLKHGISGLCSASSPRIFCIVLHLHFQRQDTSYFCACSAFISNMRNNRVRGRRACSSLSQVSSLVIHFSHVKKMNFKVPLNLLFMSAFN